MNIFDQASSRDVRLEVFDAKESHATVANRTKRDGWGSSPVAGPIMGIPLNQECPGMVETEIPI